jgi:hypothetical protein
MSSAQRPLPDITQHSQQTSVLATEFEPTILQGERPKTYALGRAANATGKRNKYETLIGISISNSNTN